MTMSFASMSWSTFSPMSRVMVRMMPGSC